MPRYLIGDKDGIVWNEPTNCYDETQAIVKGKKKAFTTDEEGNKVQVAEGYPCWENGDALSDEEIEASKPTLEEKLEPVMTTLQDFYDKCQKLDLTELPSDWSTTIGNAKELGITPEQALELYVIWKENLQAYEDDVREWWDKQ